MVYLNDLHVSVPKKIKKLDQVVHLITSFQQVQSPTCPRLCGTSELVMGL